MKFFAGIMLTLALLVSSTAAADEFQANGTGTKNFVANGDNVRPEYLKLAERYRLGLAVFWTGEPLGGNWSKPCKVRVGKEGETVPPYGGTFMYFNKGHVFGWDMQLYGSQETISASVIPHEVQHTVLLTVARRPVAKWIDEGMAALFEAPEEQAKTRRFAKEFLDHPGSVFRRFDSTQYPSMKNGQLALYATGFTLVEWLLTQKDHNVLWKFAIDKRKPSEKFRSYYGMSASEAWSRWRVWCRDRDTASPTPLQLAYSAFSPQTTFQSDKPTLYVFTTTRFFCAQCAAFKDKYNNDATFRAAINKRYNIVFKDEVVDTSMKNNFGVQSVPAFCPENSSKHVEGFEGTDWLLKTLDGLPVRSTPAVTKTPVLPEKVSRPPGSPWKVVPQDGVHTTGCRCSKCFALAFARIKALEAKVAALESRKCPPGNDGQPGPAGRSVIASRIHEGVLQFKYSDKPSDWVIVGPVSGGTGNDGSDGRGLLAARINEDYVLQFKYTDKPNTWVSLGNVRGPKGETPKTGDIRQVIIVKDPDGNIIDNDTYTLGKQPIIVQFIRDTSLDKRIKALEPLLRREVRVYVGNKLVDSLSGDEALKPGDPIPLYAIPRKSDKTTTGGK